MLLSLLGEEIRMSRLFKSITIILVTGLIVELASQEALAALGTPTVYRVTVRRIEISKDGGTTWVTVGSGDLTFNIASANAGAVVGTYVSNATVDAGTYNKMRATISRTYTLRGSIVQDAGANNGTRFYTSANGATQVAGNEGEQSITAPTNVTLPTGISLSPDGDFYATMDVNLTFTASGPNTVTVNFDVTNAMQLLPDDTFIPQPPSVTVTN